MAVKVPGQRANLLLKIVAILAIVTAPPLLFWATHIALTAEHVIIVAVAELFTIFLVGALSGRRRENDN